MHVTTYLVQTVFLNISVSLHFVLVVLCFTDRISESLPVLGAGQ